MELRPPALRAWSLSHWTTRKVPNSFLLSSRLTVTGVLPQHHSYVISYGNNFWIWKLSFFFTHTSLSGSSFSSVQSVSHVQLSATLWIAARQASLSITNSWSSPKLMCIESMMPSSHLILCHPLLLLPSIPPSIRVFSNESTLHMRWPKYWSFSLSISPSNEHPGLVSFRLDGVSLQSKGLSRVSSTTVQKHQFFGAQLSSQSNSHIHTWPLEKP